MIKIEFDFEKISDVLTTVNTISHTVFSTKHVNDLLKTANSLITSEFVIHMTKQAVSAPKKFGHMYDWGGVGDPNARLWRHKMHGRGSNRELTFEFKASKRTVPVSPKLQEVGVKRNHVFVWKAPVIELGLPVRISNKLAKALVFEEKEVKNPARSSGVGYAANGIMVFNGTINIDRQGNKLTWNSFTAEFQEWFNSPRPSQIIRENLEKKISKNIAGNVEKKLASLKSNPKSFTMKPLGIDPSFQKTLENSLSIDYSRLAQNRRIVSDE